MLEFVTVRSEEGISLAVRRFAFCLALVAACRAEEPPLAPTAAPAPLPPLPTVAAAPAPSAPAGAAAPVPKAKLVPIPLDRFEDDARHYRNANGLTDYPRYLPEQYVGIAENILLHQRTNGGWRENWDPARILGE